MVTELNSSAARAEILRRIREANGGAADTAAVQQQWGAIDRGYQRAARRSRSEIIDLFEDRLRDYDAHVIRATSREVSSIVRKMLLERDRRRIVVPPGLDATWLPADFNLVVDEEFSSNELDGFEGVITAATVAVAETGSVVLQNTVGQGRRAITLVPDYHLCVVREQDIVETVPEALEQLEATKELPTTFFSGPSATADIEMTRIKGVHGPRFLDIILLA